MAITASSSISLFVFSSPFERSQIKLVTINKQEMRASTPLSGAAKILENNRKSG